MEESLKLHYEWKGKIETKTRVGAKSKDSLSLAYTPGVAAACLEINKDISKSFDLTRRWNTVAVITDGTAVLGLGDIGPEAGMPVMEGKCLLFKEYGDVDAVPICIKSKDTDEIVRTIQLISGSFGGINLEDIAAPRCFEIEEKLKEICDIPIFHDDQHGTAVVVTAGVINALKVVGKKIENVKTVISGAGAAGCAIGKLLTKIGAGNILICDRKGIICDGDDLTPAKQMIADFTNKNRERGSLADALVDADIFIGVSAPGIVTKEMVKSMADGAIVLAMANPVPEIMPQDALEAGAAVVGTGRSDFPNQINNVIAFPGIFRGAFDVRAKDINEEMQIAAAYAIASLADNGNLSSEYIIPTPFDDRIAPCVAAAVSKAAIESKVAQKLL